MRGRMSLWRRSRRQRTGGWHVHWAIGNGLTDGFRALLAGSDADHFGHRHEEYLAVPDLAGPGGVRDDRRDTVCLLFRDHDLDLRLLQQVYRVLRAAVVLRVAFLLAGAADLRDGHAAYSGLRERRLHILQLLRPNQRLDLDHIINLLGPRRADM